MKNLLTISVLALGTLMPACASAQATDGLPKYTVAYFTQACPDGWTVYNDADGRFLLPVPDGGGVAARIGTALSDVDSAGKHTHTAIVTANPDSVERSANTASTKHRASPLPVPSELTTTSKESALLPAVSYLVCQKTVDGNNATINPGVTTFFTTTTCPSNWAPIVSARGRYIVGLPDDATASANFGGKALSVGEERTHNHNFSGQLNYGNAGLKESGGQHRFAKPRETAYDDHTGDSAVSAPYLTLTFCTKQ